MKNPAGKEKVIGSINVQKSIAPHEDSFGSVHLAIRQYVNETLDQEIILTEPETFELQDILNQINPQQGEADTSEPKSAHLEEEDDDSLEDDLEDLTDEDEATDKFLLLETRISGGKKKIVLNWCENGEEVTEALQTIYKRNELTEMNELYEKVKIVKYTEVSDLADFWIAAPEEDEEEDDDK